MASTNIFDRRQPLIYALGSGNEACGTCCMGEPVGGICMTGTGDGKGAAEGKAGNSDSFVSQR